MAISYRKFLGQDITVGEAVCDSINLFNRCVYQTTPTMFDAILYMEQHGGITQEDQVYRFYDLDYDEDPLFAFRRRFTDATHFIVEYRMRRGEPTDPVWGDESTGWWTYPHGSDTDNYQGAVWNNITADDRWKNGIWFFKADIYSTWQNGINRWEYPIGAALGHIPIVDETQGDFTDQLMAGAYVEVESGTYAGCYQPAEGSTSYVVADYGNYISTESEGAFLMLALNNLSEEINNYEDDIAGPGGGYTSGGYDFSSAHIGFAGLPTISILDTGMACMFNPNTAQARAFANFLWSDDFFDNILKLINDPLENVISFASVPLNLNTLHDESVTVKVGNVSTGVAMPKLKHQYITVNLGTVAIPHTWDTALDYEPGSQIECFLPFCGMFNMSASEVRGGSVTLQYNIDLLSGDFVAQLRCRNKEHKSDLDDVLYHKTGNLLTNFPLTEANYANFYKSIVSGAAGAVSGAVTGNPLLATNSMVDAALSIGSVELERTGSFSGAASGMSCRKAYLVLTQPSQHLPADYNKYIGWPSYIRYKLSTLSGYTQVEEVIDNTVVATDDEKAEIERLLKEGIIL